MTEECITPLRRRMIEDMSVRHFASKTQHDYIRTVMKLTRFLGQSPDTATNEDLRRFQLHLTENRSAALDEWTSIFGSERLTGCFARPAHPSWQHPGDEW
jgi:hypothetical protein